MKKKDVLLVDLIGTLPVYTAYFTNGLLKNGIELDIISPKRFEELDNFPFLTLNYKYLYNHFTYKGKFQKFFKLISWILNCIYVLILAPKYKNIHLIWLPLVKENNWDYNFISFLKIINPNIVFTVHATFHHDVYSEVFEQRLKKICQKTPYLVTHSEFTKNSLNEKFNIPEQKIIVMGHGPMLSELKEHEIQKSTSPFRMAIIGSMKKYKGIEDALRFTAYLKNKGHIVELLLAGGGSESFLDSIRKLIKKLEIEKETKCIFRFLTTQEVVKFNIEANCILSPYNRIGQSGAAISALSLGTPVIGYKTGGLPYIIKNFKNGYLAKMGDFEDMELGINWVNNTDQKDIKEGIDKLLKVNSWAKTASILKECYSIEKYDG